NVLKYDHDKLRKELSGPEGASLVGYEDSTLDNAIKLFELQQYDLHPFIPSGYFGSNSPLHSALQAFKFNNEYYSYKGEITPGSMVPTTPTVDTNWKKEPVSDYIENYGGGVHVADQTPAILKAIDAGVRRIILPKGELRMSPCTIPGYTQGLTFVGQGANQAYSGTTVIKPLNDGQNYIFGSGDTNDGQDSIKFENIQFDGEWRCNHAILHTRGAGWYYEKLTGKRFKTWFIYDGQGLARFSDIYCEATDASNKSIRATGGGIAFYSDSSMINTEVYGGSIPIRLLSGGCRLVNCWANGGYDVGSVGIIPLDGNTNSLTSYFSNCGFGETSNSTGAVIPSILITGNNTFRVYGVVLSNVTFFHAEHRNTKMLFIKASYCTGLQLSNVFAQGFENYADSDTQTLGFLEATNCTDIVMSSTVMKGVNRNPIVLNNSAVTIDSSVFDNWGATLSEQVPAILSRAGSRCRVGSSTVFFSNQRNSYAVYAEDEYAIDASVLNIDYPGSIIMLPTGKPFSYMYKRSGGKLTLVNTFTP
ncbi:TPA: hypothetical protein OGN27_004149, partial [Escherichia coli]|nr:hypothetical protein [Escherichia coli]